MNANIKHWCPAYVGPQVTRKCQSVTTMNLELSGASVSKAAALDLAVACKTYGSLSDSDLRQIGLDGSDVKDGSARLPESVFISLWQAIAKHHAGEAVGLRLGTTINPQAKGLLASWVSQSTDLREALHIFCNNILLMNPSESWDVQETRQDIRLVCKLQEDKGYPTIAIERSMSAMLTWARALSGHSFPIHLAEFAFPAPPYADEFIAVFGDRLVFDGTQNQIILDAGVLKLPVLSNNPLLKNIIQEKATQALAEIALPESLEDKVKTLIQRDLASNKSVSISATSEALAMSRQTLYRQLKQAKTDFQSLHEAVKKEEALKMLEAGNKVSVVALSLGYKDTSSFYKAFKRWFNTSPKSYSRSDLSNKP